MDYVNESSFQSIEYLNGLITFTIQTSFKFFLAFLLFAFFVLYIILPKEPNVQTEVEKSPVSAPIPKNKSLLKIDKNKVLAFGSQGTVLYNGVFQDQEVAVKRIVKSEWPIANHEIEILINLSHPNIIKYYFFEEKKNYVNLVLEKCLCSISDYIQFINNQKSQSSQEMFDKLKLLFKRKQLTTQQILMDIVRGVIYLQENKIIHRDIKPDNILIS